MKKTHWLRNTVLILAVCIAAGLILSGILFFRSQNRTSVETSITFTFNGAAEGLAPNGYFFTPDEIASDEVVVEALKEANLFDSYDPAIIQANLSIRGTYPEDLVEQMTSYDDTISWSGASRNVKLSNYIPTTYTVTLYSDFDQNISPDKLRGLLNSILASYQSYLARSSAMGELKADLLENLTDYDYYQQTEFISIQLEEARAYAQNMIERAPLLRVDGKGFSDIALQFNMLITNDLNTVNSLISTNALARELSRQLEQYTYRVQTLQNQITIQSERLSRLEELISTFAKNGIIYLANGDSFRKVDDVSSEEYDLLVDQRNEVVANIAFMKSQVMNYKNRLSALEIAKKETQNDTSEDSMAALEVKATTEQTDRRRAELERRLSILGQRTSVSLTELGTLLRAYNLQEINENTIVAGSVRFYKPSLLSGAFLKQAVKTTGPICALGLIAALVLIILSRQREMKVL